MSVVYKEKGFKGFTIGYLGVQYRQAMYVPYFSKSSLNIYIILVSPYSIAFVMPHL